MKFFAVVLIATCSLAVHTFARPVSETFSLDKNHTYVGFDVSYLIVLRAIGRFNDFEGSFVIDREYPENNRADIIIKTSSVDTGVELQNKDIRGPGLFNTAHHPTMTFHSKSIKFNADNTGRITGDLTLLGITKPITLDIVRVPHTSDLQDTDKDKNFADGFKVTGKIKRSDFGMNAFIRPIGNTVTLLVCYRLPTCHGEQGTKAPEASYNK